ncbi:MAG: hypothetical protein KJ749_07960 [Planctomycetes bacterium]|nr:hypothetical protein [Planctomycetota bacterium]
MMSEPPTDAGVATDPDPGKPQLIDVPPPWTSWHWVVPVTAVAAVIPVCLLTAVWWPEPTTWKLVTAIVVVIALPLVVYYHVSELRSRKYLNKVLSSEPHADFVDLLKYGAKCHGGAALIGFLQDMVCALAQHGYVGTTIRHGMFPHQAPAIDPIPVNFEARPLDEADESVIALEEAVDDLQDSDEAEPESTATRAPLARRARRNFALGGGCLSTGIYSMMILMGLWDSTANGRIAPMLIVGIGWMMLHLFMAGGLGSVFGYAQWFVVPGGVLVRDTGRRAKDVCLHVYDRRESALIVHRMRAGSCAVLVADADSHHRTTITRHEATLLLRAWLSPVPPPPVEQLTDLM